MMAGQIQSPVGRLIGKWGKRFRVYCRGWQGSKLGGGEGRGVVWLDGYQNRFAAVLTNWLEIRPS